MIEKVHRCIHCLNPAPKTRDHVFPSSWYPRDTPSTVQRPVAPSCRPCNGEFGKLENNILFRLGLCVDPERVEAAGIPALVLRSVGIGADEDLSAKEKGIRAKLRAKLRNELRPYDPASHNRSVLPGFGPHASFPAESQATIYVSADILISVCKKIVRGLEFWLAERYIEAPYVLNVFFINEGAAQEFEKNFREPATHLGPGFNVRRAAAYW